MKQVYSDTFGCQMNVADTDRMELLLFHSGYIRTGEVQERARPGGRHRRGVLREYLGIAGREMGRPLCRGSNRRYLRPDRGVGTDNH